MDTLFPMPFSTGFCNKHLCHAYNALYFLCLCIPVTYGVIFSLPVTYGVTANKQNLITMLTIQTQVAITILHSIATSHESHSLGRLFSTNIVSELLEQLEMGKSSDLFRVKRRVRLLLMNWHALRWISRCSTSLKPRVNILIAIIPLPRILLALRQYG